MQKQVPYVTTCARNLSPIWERLLQMVKPTCAAWLPEGPNAGGGPHGCP